MHKHHFHRTQWTVFRIHFNEFPIFMMDFLLKLKATLRHQVHRLRKKVADLKNQNTKSESITPDDRFVYTKNA